MIWDALYILSCCMGQGGKGQVVKVNVICKYGKCDFEKCSTTNVSLMCTP